MVASAALLSVEIAPVWVLPVLLMIALVAAVTLLAVLHPSADRRADARRVLKLLLTQAQRRR